MIRFQRIYIKLKNSNIFYVTKTDIMRHTRLFIELVKCKSRHEVMTRKKKTYT